MSMKKGLKDKFDSTTNSMKDKLNDLDKVVNEKKIDRQQAKFEKERKKKEDAKKAAKYGGALLAILFIFGVVFAIVEDEPEKAPGEPITVSVSDEKEASSSAAVEKEDKESKEEPNDILDEDNTSLEVGSKEIPLTIDNCPELVQILSIPATYHISYVNFAQKYSGDYIEFDGHILYYSTDYNEDEDYVYTILIGGGDYLGPDKAPTGPNFQAREVNSSAFGQTGMSTEEEIKVGNNIKIKARVGNFNKSSELFYLENFKAELR